MYPFTSLGSLQSILPLGMAVRLDVRVKEYLSEWSGVVHVGATGPCCLKDKTDGSYWCWSFKMLFIENIPFVSLGLERTHGKYHSMRHLDQSRSRNLPNCNKGTFLSDTKYWYNKCIKTVSHTAGILWKTDILVGGACNKAPYVLAEIKRKGWAYPL